MSGHAEGWFFLALPDHPSAEVVSVRARPVAEVLASHPSGRPWLLGRLPAGHAVVHTDGPNRLAVLGATSATSAQLGRISDSAGSIGDVAGVSARFAGSYCVVGSLGGTVYAQGSAIGTCRVFHALVDGVRVVADRADVLAELAGLPLDEAMLALRFGRMMPHPFLTTPLWRGVQPVPPEDYVTVHRDGTSHRGGTWWRRPRQELSRVEGVRTMREALVAAVGARTAAGGRISCDLSGGLDSTPVCYFAARGPAEVLARTMHHDGPGGEQDLTWARLALPSMPGVREHVVESTSDMPDFFGGFADTEDRLDEPTQSLMAAPRIAHVLRDSARRGARCHLNGLGGDHLLGGLEVHEHTLFRTRPLLAWRRAREHDIPRGRRLRDTLGDLLDRTSYRDWLHTHLQAAVRDDERARRALSDWSGAPPQLPPWLSAAARESLAATTGALIRTAEPLGADRAAHVELDTLREAGRTTRGAAQLGPRAGIRNEAPLLDDHVVEAVLAVRREERGSPVEWKPMMKQAMRGLLPDEFLLRTTKVSGAPQGARGFRAHHREVLALCESSGLADTGLIDLAAFAAAIRPAPTAGPHRLLDETVNIALFLRNRAPIFPAGVSAFGPTP